MNKDDDKTIEGFLRELGEERKPRRKCFQVIKGDNFKVLVHADGYHFDDEKVLHFLDEEENLIASFKDWDYIQQVLA